MEAQVYQRYIFGPFVLDPMENLLLREGQAVPVPDKALETLLMLVQSPGHLIAKAELLQRVWPNTFVEEATLAQNISTLRKALNGSPGDAEYIETVPRHGYRFIAPVKVLDVPGRVRPASPTKAMPLRISRPLLWAGAAGVLLALALGVYLGGRLRRPVSEPSAGGTLTLAVLPFDNFTGDAAQDYLSEGLTEEMIAQLSHLDPERVRVIARTTAMQYKGTHKTVAQIGRELGADYILESSFRREGSRARITTQLVRTNDQIHIWSQEYERDVREILPLESEVAQSIAQEIAVKLSPEAQNRLAVHRAIDPEAYQLYLQGRYFWNKRSEQGHLKAIDFFQQAIAIQPQYAQAYSGLADAYALLGSNPTTAMTRPEAMSKARAAALQALAIDNTIAEAHTSLAFVYWHYDWNWPAAEREFQRAIQLNPSYPTAHHWYAFYLVSQGRTEQGLAEVRVAQQIDPLSLIINTDVAQILYFARQYPQSIAQAKQVLDMDPDFSLARLILVWDYLTQQQFGPALAEAEQGIGVPGTNPHMDVNLAVAYVLSGKSTEARAILRHITTVSEDTRGESIPIGIAQAYAALGEKDQAFLWLEKDLQHRDGGLTLLKVFPFLDSLHDDPRFVDLLRRIGLPA
jgi:TolB-like protein/DNA-binding winged helix-turn-helix (wHTH) protein/Flp pilus assembly protein TadD